MRIVLSHAWLRGNLGDFCIAYRTVSLLRRQFPDAYITLLTEPRGTWYVPDALTSLVDAYIERSFRDDFHNIAEHADVVIQVPGGGLQDSQDPRAPFMLRDAEICHRLGVKHIFAGHSFHSSYDLSALHRSVVFAREPASHDLLLSQGIQAFLTADLAFLEPVPAISDTTSRTGGTLLFLRQWHFADIKKQGKRLHFDGRIETYTHEPLILVSSDPLRDNDILLPLRDTYGLRYEPCMDLQHLFDVIASSSHVISDRYHPIIFASMMGVPFTFLQREGSLRDAGLSRMLQQSTPHACAALARDGCAQMLRIIGRQ